MTGSVKRWSPGHLATGSGTVLLRGKKDCIGLTGFEPATTRPPDVCATTALQPVGPFPRKWGRCQSALQLLPDLSEDVALFFVLQEGDEFIDRLF